MKKLLIYTILSLILSLSSTIKAEDGDWKIYASFHHPTKAIKIGKRYFVLANGDQGARNFSYNTHLDNYQNLYVFDSEDSSLGTYNKSNALSDYGIYDIAYSKTTNKIIIIYTNGNIDIMNSHGGCDNLPDFKNKALANKTIREINVTKDKAYISTGSGIIVINLNKVYIENFYNLGYEIISTKVSESNIYAKTATGIYVGNKDKNLLDSSNWILKSEGELRNDANYTSIINENANDIEALEYVSRIIPDSPLRNYCYKLNMVGERLLIAGGNWYYNPERDLYRPTVMMYENDKWSAFDEIEAIKGTSERLFTNVTDVVQDPNDATHHFLSTKGGGVFEFKNFKFTKHYGYGNSPLKTIIENNPYYVRITGLQYDHDGNLWMLNNYTDTIIRILTKNGKWIGKYYSQIEKFETFDNIMFDSRHYAWINSRRTTNSGSLAGILVIDTKENNHVFINSFNNQDGNSVDMVDEWYCATEDIDGAVWLGNNRGLFVSNNPKKLFEKDYYLTQIKVSRNDGTNLADYLLADVGVKCIAIDGGNRKWIGTTNNGVYLISADGQEIIEHFTKDNSPLISDNINDIAINGKTGEVFIATGVGLCSYMGSAIDPSETMEDNTLKVYPNPVRPENNSEVHITGLMYNSDVKIVSAAGRLVYSGTSIGGKFTWNCCNQSGKKCNSGIYYALCTDENGQKGACAKILIIQH